MVFWSCSWCNGSDLVLQWGLGLGLGTGNGVFHTFLLLKWQTPLFSLPLAMPLYTSTFMELWTFMDDAGLSMAVSDNPQLLQLPYHQSCWPPAYKEFLVCVVVVPRTSEADSCTWSSLLHQTPVESKRWCRKVKKDRQSDTVQSLLQAVLTRSILRKISKCSC